jgi:metal-responsive CopG/Arc/MetJ family transcriptional regulator
MKAIRTLIDLADTQIRALDELARKEKRSRAGLKRQAIDEYLARKPSKQDGDAFGSGENVGWTDRPIRERFVASGEDAVRHTMHK